MQYEAKLVLLVRRPFGISLNFDVPVTILGTTIVGGLSQIVSSNGKRQGSGVKADDVVNGYMIQGISGDQARTAGLQIGDVLVKIDKLVLSSFSEYDIKNLLQFVDVPVTLVVLRDSGVYSARGDERLESSRSRSSPELGSPDLKQLSGLKLTGPSPVSSITAAGPPVYHPLWIERKGRISFEAMVVSLRERPFGFAFDLDQRVTFTSSQIPANAPRSVVPSDRVIGLLVANVMTPSSSLITGDTVVKINETLVSDLATDAIVSIFRSAPVPLLLYVFRPRLPASPERKEANDDSGTQRKSSPQGVIIERVSDNHFKSRPPPQVREAYETFSLQLNARPFGISVDFNYKLMLSAHNVIGGLPALLTSRCVTGEHRDEDEKLIGFVVDDVQPNSVAESAGLRSGDYVVKVNSQLLEVMTKDDLINTLRSSELPVTISILRKSFVQDTTIPEPVPEPPKPTATPPPSPPPSPPPPAVPTPPRVSPPEPTDSIENVPTEPRGQKHSILFRPEPIEIEPPKIPPGFSRKYDFRSIDKTRFKRIYEEHTINLLTRPFDFTVAPSTFSKSLIGHIRAPPVSPEKAQNMSLSTAMRTMFEKLLEWWDQTDSQETLVEGVEFHQVKVSKGHAAQQGLMEGDFLVAIDDSRVVDVGSDTLMKLLQRAKVPLQLTVLRLWDDDREMMDFVLTSRPFGLACSHFARSGKAAGLAVDETTGHSHEQGILEDDLIIAIGNLVIAESTATEEEIGVLLNSVPLPIVITIARAVSKVEKVDIQGDYMLVHPIVSTLSVQERALMSARRRKKFIS